MQQQRGRTSSISRFRRVQKSFLSIFFIRFLLTPIEPFLRGPPFLAVLITIIMGHDDTNCGKCGKEVVGQAMKAKNVLYCAESCFTCADCGSDLRSVSVYSKDASLYCESHYKQNFVPKCGKCSNYILEVRSAFKLRPFELSSNCY